MSLLSSIRNIRKMARNSNRSFFSVLSDNLSSKAARLCLRSQASRTDGDPYHALFQRFVAELNHMPSCEVLEIGSRARSGNVYSGVFSKEVRYTGMDILPGPNVDIQGDIHELSAIAGTNAYDAIFSISVFEHLAMPWNAALEICRTLRPGGLVFISTHQTWPLHDRPWDFFRFSTDGFRAIFNKATGFEILDACEGLPCRIIPLGFEPSMRGLETSRDAYLGVALLARKIGDPDPRLRWDIPIREILETHYPA